METYNIALFFIAYAFLGWVCETIYVSVGKKELVNRGFLFSPLCPIYGFGALLVLSSLFPFLKYPFLIFILGVVTTSVLEYFVSWLMEKIFHIRWWDYSDYKFNIKGRVCLKNSMLFGILVIITVYGIHPVISDFITSIPQKKSIILSATLTLAILVDTVISTVSALNIDKAMTEINKIIDELQEHGELAKLHVEKNMDLLAHRLKKRQKNFQQAFPRFKHLKSSFDMSSLEELISKIHSLRKR